LHHKPKAKKIINNKNKGTKDMRLKKLKNGNKQCEKYLLKNIGFQFST
jgi:hypothetical protein